MLHFSLFTYILVSACRKIAGKYSLRRCVFVCMDHSYLICLLVCVSYNMDSPLQCVVCCGCECMCMSPNPCHLITGHTNLIIQPWALRAGVYERDCRAYCVAMLPCAQWQAVSELMSTPWQIFRQISEGLRGLSSSAKFRSVKKRSCLAAQTHEHLCEARNMSM